MSDLLLLFRYCLYVHGAFTCINSVGVKLFVKATRCPTISTLPSYNLLLERILNSIHALNFCPPTYVYYNAIQYNQ